MSTQAVYIIAEAGVNHNGSVERALQLVDAAREAGADAVKFQTFEPKALVSVYAPKAEYQKVTTGSEGNQLEMLARLTLTAEEQRRLQVYCRETGIEFLSSPFELGSARWLVEELGLSTIKLGSGELTNAPLLLAIAQTGVNLILSTGMSTLAEVESALAVLAYGYTQHTRPAGLAAIQAAWREPAARALLVERVTLLHCVTEYPSPLADINLRAMDTLRQSFGLAVGYSDHTPGITAPIAAVAREAVMVEKHLTLDKQLPGPDHLASLEPAEFAAMVRAIREVELALGDGRKLPAACEVKNMAVARKSLVAAAPLQAGETFHEANLTTKRPGTGRSPMLYWDLLGQQALRDYAEDEVIEP